MKINTDEKLINELLTRGVEHVYPSAEFLKAKLKSGKQLKLYLGIDPTGPSLHVGHAIVLMKLRQFQDLGHKIIILIGSFTAMIGDPTDKMAARQPLTRKQVLENCKNYKKQAAKILNVSKIKFVFNHKWWDRMKFAQLKRIADRLTVQQLLHRDMFEKRMDEGREISVTEFLYPLLQGYDSVAMDVDGELGGNDQTFNMQVGRDLMKKMMDKEKFVLTMKLLADPTGKKMGKSEGNMIALEESAQEMFGKVMSWTDEMILAGFELCTFASSEKIENAKKRLASGENPRDLKLALAEAVAAIYHGADKAAEAKEIFLKVFQKKEQPDEIQEFDLAGKNIVDVLIKSHIGMKGQNTVLSVLSKSEVRRLIDQGGIKINNVILKNADAVVKSGDIIQKGKRYFIKIK